jgi:hypothetical protein
MAACCRWRMCRIPCSAYSSVRNMCRNAAGHVHSRIAGVVVPASAYASGAYNSLSCVPTAAEAKMYLMQLARSPLSARRAFPRRCFGRCAASDLVSQRCWA